jgi:hypothetical protein
MATKRRVRLGGITLRVEVIRRRREHDYGEYLYRIPFNEAAVIEWVPADDPLRHLHADKAFDDDHNATFAHIGHGTPKSAGTYNKPRKTYPNEWVAYAHEVVLK